MFDIERLYKNIVDIKINILITSFSFSSSSFFFILSFFRHFSVFFFDILSSTLSLLLYFFFLSLALFLTFNFVFFFVFSILNISFFFPLLLSSSLSTFISFNLFFFLLFFACLYFSQIFFSVHFLINSKSLLSVNKRFYASDIPKAIILLSSFTATHRAHTGSADSRLFGIGVNCQPLVADKPRKAQQKKIIFFFCLFLLNSK